MPEWLAIVLLLGAAALCFYGSAVFSFNPGPVPEFNAAATRLARALLTVCGIAAVLLAVAVAARLAALSNY